MEELRPKTHVKFDARSLADLLRAVKNRTEARREVQHNPVWAAEVPREVGMQLTYKCNLRCAHCYQWSEQGFFHFYGAEQQRGELPVAIVERVLCATDAAASKVYLWGGEPLMHSRFADIARLLAPRQRTVNICSNGLLLERQFDSLQSLGAGLVLLISLDGLEVHHDALRGRGTFAKTVQQIRTLLERKRRGEFLGEVSLSAMVSNQSIGQLYEVAQHAEELGVNSIYFQFPWYIGPEAVRKMDALYESHFAWLDSDASRPRSWHSYSYGIAPERIAQLREDMVCIAARTWHTRIRYQPELEEHNLEDFLLGGWQPAQNRRVCLAIANRLEVHADGNVSSCKFFPEFRIGNLHDTDVAELWHGERFGKIRALLRETGLTPLCAKCYLLYNNGD